MTARIHHLPVGSGTVIPDRGDRDWITRAELTADAGITARQADYWTRTDLLAPINDGRRGSGHLQRYTPDQVTRAAAIRELLHAGVSLSTIRAHLDEYLTTGRIICGPITLTRTTTKENHPA